MNSNELYECAYFERKPTVFRLLEAFPSRLAAVTAALGGTKEVQRAIEQFGKVSRCHGSYEQTNGKTFHNLFQASAKLNGQLLNLESQARFTGNCNNCGHRKHETGLCSMCGCGTTEIIGGY